ncbi:MAG: ParM/StbA family protein [Clostridium tyrobutyricum]|jgi:plasmid segregation protein ParM|uniref:ParM/StbA family protein n=1 Tax=Clostridium tyrobutyricum TaxID=1519 RepID=UPI00242DF820|nr:ParM/StbA family protein [Clostridium tyrobutyricum]MCH4201323.1 ParM/StbA family protein [Clostridium tyrobutyricum]MCH4259298.1 ParM/StbA family protein [Clostridium tyrobutyricum]
MYKIGLDLGYKYVKGVADNGKTVCFPSIIALNKSSKIDKDTVKFFGIHEGKKPIEDNLCIVISKDGYEERFKVGNAAVNEKNVRYTFQDDKCNSIENNICLAAASAVLFPGEDEEIFLVSGLPITDFSKQKKVFKKMLLNYNVQVKIPDYNINKKIHFDRVELVPQGLAAVYAAVWNDLKKYSIPGSYIGLIDWGGKTVDYAVFRINSEGMPEYLPDYSGTIYGGMFQIENDITTIFKERYGDELIYSNLLRLIDTGKIFFNRQEIDLSQDIRDIKNDRAGRVLNEITKKWIDIIKYFNTIFISGGGGKDMYDNIFNVPGALTVELASNPQMGNAIGYYRIASLAGLSR